MSPRGENEGTYMHTWYEVRGIPFFPAYTSAQPLLLLVVRCLLLVVS